MRFAHQIRALVVEGGVEEEPLVVELEVLVGLANATLAKRQELLALRKGPHGHGPFFESNRHLVVEGKGVRDETRSRARHVVQRQHRKRRLYAREFKSPNMTANRWVSDGVPGRSRAALPRSAPSVCETPLFPV